MSTAGQDRQMPRGTKHPRARGQAHPLPGNRERAPWASMPRLPATARATHPPGDPSPWPRGAQHTLPKELGGNQGLPHTEVVLMVNSLKRKRLGAPGGARQSHGQYKCKGFPALRAARASGAQGAPHPPPPRCSDPVSWEPDGQGPVRGTHPHTPKMTYHGTRSSSETHRASRPPQRQLQGKTGHAEKWLVYPS